MPHGDWPAAGALVQPIMAKWLGNSFNMFEEIFDWTDESDEQTRKPLSPAFLTRLIPPLACPGGAQTRTPSCLGM